MLLRPPAHKRFKGRGHTNPVRHNCALETGEMLKWCIKTSHEDPPCGTEGVSELVRRRAASMGHGTSDDYSERWNRLAGHNNGKWNSMASENGASA